MGQLPVFIFFFCCIYTKKNTKVSVAILSWEDCGHVCLFGTCSFEQPFEILRSGEQYCLLYISYSDVDI